MSKEDLLKIRKRIKTRKPKFIRQDAHKKKEVNDKWRKPKGRDNQMRLKRKGYPQVVSIGFKKSKQEEQFIIHNQNDLKKAKKTKQFYFLEDWVQKRR